MKQIFLFLFLLGFVSDLFAQPSDTTREHHMQRFGSVASLGRYLVLTTGIRTIDPDNPVTLDPEEIAQLRIRFRRDSLRDEEGPQFLKVSTSSVDKGGQLLDQNVQFAVTFSSKGDVRADLRELDRIRAHISPLGFMNPDLIDEVPIQVDSLSLWGRLVVRVEPEQDVVKYYGRIRNTLEFQILVRGSRFDVGFTLSVPKIVYDTRSSDSVQYGNTSAMLRFYYLDQEHGTRYPLSIGVGTIGINSPIDVSKSGGGFVVSFYLDLIQLLRMDILGFARNINAGFDVSPFFPLKNKSRVLLGIRVGITP